MGLRHGVGLQDPGGSLLIEERPERRHEREEHQHPQDRAHALDGFVADAGRAPRSSCSQTPVAAEARSARRARGRPQSRSRTSA